MVAHEEVMAYRCMVTQGDVVAHCYVVGSGRCGGSLVADVPG